MKKFLFGVCISLMTTSTALAGPIIPESMRQSMQTEYSGMPSLLNLIVSMVVVIALIYITGWAYTNLSRYNQSKLGNIQKNKLEKNKFSVVSSMPLGSNKNLYAVEINNKILVLGATQNNISLLKEFDSTCELESKEVVIEEKHVKQVPENNKKLDFDNLDKNLNDISSIYNKYRS